MSMRSSSIWAAHEFLEILPVLLASLVDHCYNWIFGGKDVDLDLHILNSRADQTGPGCSIIDLSAGLQPYNL